MKTFGSLYDLIVIGAGPAGMMMAGRAAQLGASVLVLEKNKVVGKKLSISGGGRCNITNVELPTRALLDHFPESREFLYSPFSKFSSQDAIKFFEKESLPIVVEARHRAFPKSQKATDVTATMERYTKKHNVVIHKGAQVISLKVGKDGIFTLKDKHSGQYKAKAVAVAAGGLAAPETGSTGDGFKLLTKLGHTIKKPNPNIVPLTSNTQWVQALSGTSLSFMKISFIQNGKVRLKKTGKILFTHFGLSGPLILNSAFEVKKLLDEGPVTAAIDLFPDTEEHNLDRRLWRLFEKNKNKQIENVLPEFLPKNLTKEILQFSDLDLAGTKVHSVTKDQRKNLVKRMKSMTLNITGTLGFEKAVTADGGVALEEVDFKTMSSRLHPNLYLIGDTLNINRPSGGYSLQLCWTTGWVAGTAVGENLSRT